MLHLERCLVKIERYQCRQLGRPTSHEYHFRWRMWLSWDDEKKCRVIRQDQSITNDALATIVFLGDDSENDDVEEWTSAHLKVNHTGQMAIVLESIPMHYAMQLPFDEFWMNESAVLWCPVQHKKKFWLPCARRKPRKRAGNWRVTRCRNSITVCREIVRRQRRGIHARKTETANQRATPRV